MVLVAHVSDMDAGLENYSGALRNTPTAIVEMVDPDYYAYIGSGSSNWHAFFNDISGSAVKIVTQSAENKSVPLESIQRFTADTWSVSMDRLADYCMTTRRSLYNWRDNINPRDYAAERLFTLYRIAKDWQEAGSPSPNQRIHEKLLGDKSLHDLLLEEKLDIEAIAFIRSRLDLAAVIDTPIADPFKG